MSEDRGEMMMRSSSQEREIGRCASARRKFRLKLRWSVGRECFYCVLKRLFTLRPEQTGATLPRTLARFIAGKKVRQEGDRLQWRWVVQ